MKNIKYVTIVTYNKFDFLPSTSFYLKYNYFLCIYILFKIFSKCILSQYVRLHSLNRFYWFFFSVTVYFKSLKRIEQTINNQPTNNNIDVIQTWVCVVDLLPLVYYDGNLTNCANHEIQTNFISVMNKSGIDNILSEI